MSKEKEKVKEAQDELVDVEQEAWVVEDWVDSIQDFADVFVYSFRQGGKQVTGLTARAIEELCLMNEPKVSIIKSNVERTENEVIATATAEMIFYHPAVKETKADGTVIETEAYGEGVRADGIRVEPRFFRNGNPDPHVEMKALTKAERAARRQLLSQEKQVDAKKSLLKLQGGEPIPVPQSAIPENTGQAPKQTKQHQVDGQAVETARKAMFAKYNERKPELEKLGITNDIFKEGLYKNYGVQSRAEMSEGQYRNAYAALDIEGKFAKWILNLAPKPEAESEEGTAASPF